jgi:hypothetical protein
MDAETRTRKLKVYISDVLEKYGVKSGIRLMDRNDRSKGCKLWVYP